MQAITPADRSPSEASAKRITGKRVVIYASVVPGEDRHDGLEPRPTAWSLFLASALSVGPPRQFGWSIGPGGVAGFFAGGFLLVSCNSFKGVEPGGQCINLVQPGLKFRDSVTLRTNLT